MTQTGYHSGFRGGDVCRISNTEPWFIVVEVHRGGGQTVNRTRWFWGAATRCFWLGLRGVGRWVQYCNAVWVRPSHPLTQKRSSPSRIRFSAQERQPRITNTDGGVIDVHLYPARRMRQNAARRDESWGYLLSESTLSCCADR
jgi:hypothetical protein